MSDLAVCNTLVFNSQPELLSDAYKHVLKDLEACDFNRQDIFSVHLAMEEACVNAIKHGNKMDLAKEVTLDYKIYADRIELSVTDQGDGFNPDTVADPRCGDNIYKAGGRGLFLIRMYMDDVQYSESGNCVCMIKYKQGATVD